MSPLHIASAWGHVGVVRCLVNDFDADVHKGDTDGTTALFIAAQSRG
jgi:ankyrin repeat protein